MWWRVLWLAWAEQAGRVALGELLRVRGRAEQAGRVAWWYKWRLRC